MSTIRSYLKQKIARGFNRKGDIEAFKKELKDEITHVLYDQTRRTPIVIPVVNEINTTPSGQIRPDQEAQAAPAPAPVVPRPMPFRSPTPVAPKPALPREF
jgi:ribonuclease J